MEFMLIDDVQALRQKLSYPTQPLQRYWDNFLELATTDPIGEFQSLPPLAWLVPGDNQQASMSFSCAIAENLSEAFE